MPRRSRHKPRCTIATTHLVKWNMHTKINMQSPKKFNTLFASSPHMRQHRWIIEHISLRRYIRVRQFPIRNDKFCHRSGLTFSMSARALPSTRNRNSNQTKKRAWCAINRRNHKVISISSVQWTSACDTKRCINEKKRNQNNEISWSTFIYDQIIRHLSF